MTLGEFELQKLQVDKFDWREIRVHFEHIVLEQLLVGKQKFNLFLIPDVLRMLLQQVFAGLCAAELLYDEVDVELGVRGVFAGADAAGGGVPGAGVAGEGVAAAAEEEDHRAGSFAGFGAPSAAAGQPHARAVGGDAAAAGGETGRTREQLAHGGGGDLPEDPHSVFWDPAGELDEGGNNVADGRASRGSAHAFSSRPRQHQQESASTFQRHRRRRALSTQCVLDSEEAASWAAFLEEWEQKSPPLKRALRSLYEDYQTDLWFWFVLTTSSVVAVFAFFFLFLLVLIVEKCQKKLFGEMGGGMSTREQAPQSPSPSGRGNRRLRLGSSDSGEESPRHRRSVGFGAVGGRGGLNLMRGGGAATSAGSVQAGTHWCHECGRAVNLHAETGLCQNCGGGFVEEGTMILQETPALPLLSALHAVQQLQQMGSTTAEGSSPSSMGGRGLFARLGARNSASREQDGEGARGDVRIEVLLRELQNHLRMAEGMRLAMRQLISEEDVVANTSYNPSSPANATRIDPLKEDRWDSIETRKIENLEEFEGFYQTEGV
eukprot:g295.t1